MKFGNTLYFIFLWLIPILAIFLYKALQKKKLLLDKFAEIKTLSIISKQVDFSFNYLKATLLLLTASLVIFSLTEPKYGYRLEDVKKKGTDIVVAIDLSKSMLAQDIKPNRLERAKRKIHDLLNILEGDRVALVAFSGSSFLQCPLTLDYEAFQIFLDYLDPSLIPVPGTSIGNAIETSVKAFQKDSSKNKSIILITDGEDQEDSVNSVIKLLKEKEVRVFPIGIGKEEGVPIPEENGELKRNESGELVLTKLDSKSLEKLAKETNGFFIKSVSGDIDIKKIYFEGIKANSDDKEFSSTKKEVWEDRFQIFVGIALILLLLEFFVNSKTKSDKHLDKIA